MNPLGNAARVLFLRYRMQPSVVVSDRIIGCFIVPEGGLEMPVRCTVLFNRADESGWSESYYCNKTTINDAISTFAPVLAARQTLLANECWVFGVRYTTYTALRESRLIVSQNPTIGGSGSGGTLNSQSPDIGTAGALGTFINSNNRKETRLIRGIPDQALNWNAATHRMGFNATLTGALNNFATVLTATANSMGWLQSAPLNGAGTHTLQVQGLVSTAGGLLQAKVTSTAGYDPLTSGTIVLSGFRGQSAVANGQYGPLAWSVQDSTHLQFSRQITEAQALAYSGQGGYVRWAAKGFAPYVASDANTWTFVRSRNIGRPFGTTRGRRRRVA